MEKESPLLSIEYYHKIKQLYPQETHKSMFIYFYTIDSVVEKVGFRFRKKNRFKLLDDVPHDKLLLSRELKLPKAVIVQVKFNPLAFDLLEG